MATDPYRNPTTQVDPAHAGGDAPALWNPNAAANWSLLFSPVFGAFLQMKNWQALDEPHKAATAKMWAWLIFVAIAALGLFGSVLPSQALNGLDRSAGIALLLAWYFANGREQAAYVKERFGKTYPRRGWARPISVALLVSAVFFGAVFAVAFISTTSSLSD